MDAPSDQLLKAFASVPTDSRVLDLGCAHGAHCQALAELDIEVHACDVDQRLLVNARERLSEAIEPREALRRVIRTRRFSALGYPNEYFDWVVAYGTFNRLGDEDPVEEVLTEARRVLKSGGWLYVALAEVEDGHPVDVDAFVQQLEDAGYAEASAPEVIEDDDGEATHLIYRRVDEGTPA
jgi:SAM-dependent methyltransferase